MARSWPAPNGAKSALLIGDIHHGLLSDFRTQKLADYALRRDSALNPAPAITIQIGDIVDNPGQDAPMAQDTAALAWWGRFTGTKVIGVGNHDVTGRTLAAHEAIYGSSAQSIDVGPFVVVTVNYVANTTQLNAAEAMIAATTKPVVLCIHFPPRDTTQATAAPYGSVGSATPYTYALQSSVDTWLRNMISAHNNLKMVCHGHIHAWPQAAGLAMTLSNGGNTIGSLNVGATAYLGSSNGDHAPPMICYFLTMANDAGTSWEIRPRNFGAGVWAAIDPTLDKTTVLTVT